jgi:hypothetical protein
MNRSVFGGGATETTINPLVLVVMLAAIIVLLVGPRRYLLGTFLSVIFLVPLGQVVVLGGSHFTVQRLLTLAGLVRMGAGWSKIQKSMFPRKLQVMDKIFIAWAVSRAVIFMLLWGPQDAIINQCGFLVDAVGGYFVLRWLIKDEEDLVTTAKVFARLAVVLAVSMLYEHATMTNPFGLLGGVRLVPELREGKIRCQGVLQHSILAGVFGSTLLPLLLWLACRTRARVLGWLGVVGSCIITITSASSTPALAACAGILGICCWPLRFSMRMIRIGIVISILGLAMVMKAPVWFIIAHIDVVGSSSGYHRALLIDQFMRNFSEWWLLGVKDTSNWGYDLWDVQNQFVAEGEIGGLLTLVIFIWLVVRCYQIIGKARRRVRATRKREELVWILGAVLFAHCAAFFGANYFDQTKVWWFTAVAMIVAMDVASMKQPDRLAQPIDNGGAEILRGLGYSL